jgi:hypothetical protein
MVIRYRMAWPWSGPLVWSMRALSGRVARRSGWWPFRKALRRAPVLAACPA